MREINFGRSAGDGGRRVGEGRLGSEGLGGEARQRVQAEAVKCQANRERGKREIQTEKPTLTLFDAGQLTKIRHGLPVPQDTSMPLQSRKK